MPHYPLKEVKRLVREGKIDIKPNASQTASDDFGWQKDDIKKCINKLNGRLHNDNKDKNHFYKSEPHRYIPHTVMDYYKAVGIMEGNDVYTHFYIHPQSKRLVISSFKELER